MTEQPPDKPRIRTLLVDDDVAYLEVLKFFLEREQSIECHTATSAKQALDLLSEGEFEAVVSDYLMPEMDGIEFLKILRIQGKDIPFILLTARGREDVAIQALNSGADFYVEKGGDPKAQYTDIVNMIRRVTQQRRAERSVVEGERFLEELFHSVQDGISVLTSDLVIERVNHTVEEWYRDSMPLVGKRCYEAYRGRHEPCPICPSLRTVKTGRVGRERFSGIGAGAPECIDVYSFPVKNEETGEVERVIEYMRDVSEEEVAERALREVERRYLALINIMGEGVLLVGQDGRASFSNEKLAEMLGYAVDEVVGMDVSSLMKIGGAEPMDVDALHSLLEKGERVRLQVVRKDGSKVLADVTASPLSSDGALSKGAIAVIRAVDEERPAIDGLASSQDTFAKLFQTTPQMIAIVRASNGEILEVNNSFVETMGFRRDQMLGGNLVDLGILSEQYIEKFEELYASKGVVHDLESSLRTSSGQERIVRLSSFRTDLGGEFCTVYLCCDITPESGSTSELRRERDVLKRILESSPNSIVITDLEGDIVEVNSATLSILGNKTKDELIGRNAIALLGGGDSKRAARILGKLMSEGVVRDMPFTLRRFDGIVIEALVSASIVSDPLGQPIYLVGVVRDVTDQTRNKAALERALLEREQMASVVNKSSAVVFLWRYSQGWPVEYVSDNVHQFGYSAAEMTSNVVDYASVIHPDDLGRVTDELERFLADGIDDFEQDYRIVSPSGEVFWVFDRTAVVRDDKGEVEYLQGVVIDVTERKHAEERLSRMERQTKLFMDLSPAIKFMKDKLGRYVYVNKTLMEAMHVSPDDWIGKTDHEIFPSEVADRIRENDRKVLETSEFKSFIETVPQDDGPHEYLTYKFLVPSVSDSEELLAGVSIDLTERRKYERALKVANEKLQLLSSITRHDIMNQLSVLMGWMDLASSDKDGQSLQKGFSKMRQAAETIQNLLEFTSDYQDIGVKNPVWTDVSDAIAKSVAGLPLEGIGLDVSVKGLQVYSDPMLERVFRNLVDNSLRHGGKVSRIRVSHRMDGEELLLVVEDDGAGVSEADRARIFERGFGKNTGLGLYMVREILGLTGMTVKETGEEGAGARLEIRVPPRNYRFSSDKD